MGNMLLPDHTETSLRNGINRSVYGLRILKDMMKETEKEEEVEEALKKRLEATKNAETYALKCLHHRMGKTKTERALIEARRELARVRELEQGLNSNLNKDVQLSKYLTNFCNKIDMGLNSIEISIPTFYK